MLPTIETVHPDPVCQPGPGAGLCRPRAGGGFAVRVDVWGTEDGLPQSSVIAITQTHDGYLWLGTLNGLVRFDGNSFTPFNVNNTPGLPDNRIVFLFEDSRQILWVGTETAGLCAIKNGVVQKFDTGGGERKSYCAVEDAETAMSGSARRTGVISCWKDGRLDLHPSAIPEQLLQRAFHLIVSGKDGLAWQLQNGRVEKWRDGTAGKRFWRLSLANVSDHRRDSTAMPGCLRCRASRRRLLTPEGNLVVGTHGSGVFWLDDDGDWQQISTKRGFVAATSCCHFASTARAIYGLARTATAWTASSGNFFNARRNFQPGRAQSVAEDAQGGLWVAFNSRGLSYWLTNSATDYRHWQRIKRLDGAGGQAVSRSGPARAAKACSGSVRLFSAGQCRAKNWPPDFRACFKAATEKSGPAVKTASAATDGTRLEILFHQRRPAAQRRPRPGRRRKWKSLDRHRWRRAVSIARRENFFRQRAGEGHFLPAGGPRTMCLWVGTSGHGLARLARTASGRVIPPLDGLASGQHRLSD